MDARCQLFNVDCQPPPSSVSRLSKLKEDIDDACSKLLYGKNKLFKSLKPHNFPKNSSLHLLGVDYTTSDDCSIDEFFLAVRGFICLTYRTNFEPVLHCGISWKSDSGWGCTIRSAQMLLARAFVVLNRQHEYLDDSCYKKIIRLFEDCRGSPFGIHALLKINGGRQSKVSMSKKNWFSPSEAISLLRDALSQTSNQFCSKLSIYLSVDTKVVIEDLFALSENWSKAIVVVVCLRLGTKCVNKIYHHQLQKMFSVSNMLGAIGGRPRAAVYLIASAQDCLYSLDPHTTQPYQPLDSKLENKEESKKWKTFCCDKPSRISLEDLDPSLAIGFLLRSTDELGLWIDQLEAAHIAHRHFSNQDDKCGDHQTSVLFSVVDKSNEVDFTDISGKEFDMDDSGFVLL